MHEGSYHNKYKIGTRKKLKIKSETGLNKKLVCYDVRRKMSNSRKVYHKHLPTSGLCILKRM